MTYALTDHELVLDNPLRRYVLKVRDLPESERPREKLLASGPSMLSVHELMALVFVNGTKSEDVLSMSRRILTEYGERNVLSATDPRALAEDLAIPEMKAMQIVAIGELGRRYFKGSRNGAPVIRTAEDVFEYAIDMRRLGKEHLRGLYLNGHYQVIHDETISIGTVDSNMVHPREVFRPAIAYGAAGVVLVHNHPSGNVAPSDSDRAVTRQLIEAGALLGIDLIDHVVVTGSAFTSLIAEEGSEG